MATLRKRNGKWQAQVRRKGHPGITRTFLRKWDAQSWARQQELKADQAGSPIRHHARPGLMVADILTRYRDEVVPRKRGAANEVCIINAYGSHWSCQAMQAPAPKSVDEKIPVPCDHCRGTGIIGGIECRECLGRGHRVLVAGRVIAPARRQSMAPAPRQWRRGANS